MVGLQGWSQVPYFTADRRQKLRGRGQRQVCPSKATKVTDLDQPSTISYSRSPSTRTLKLWSHGWTHSLMRSESSMSSHLSVTGFTTTCDQTFCTGAHGGISNPNQHSRKPEKQSAKKSPKRQWQHVVWLPRSDVMTGKKKDTVFKEGMWVGGEWGGCSQGCVKPWTESPALERVVEMFEGSMDLILIYS